MGRLKKDYKKTSDKRKSLFNAFVDNVLAFIKAYDVFKTGFYFFKYKEDRMIKKIFKQANLTNIDNDTKEKLAYALKKTIEDVSEKDEYSLSYYVLKERNKFEDLFYDNYLECSLLDNDITKIKNCITQITDKVKTCKNMFESTETTTQTNYQILNDHEDRINILEKTNNTASTAHTSTVDEKKSDNKELTKTKKLKLVLSIAILFVVLIAILVLYYLFGNNNKKTNDKPNISTTTSSKVSTTTEPIITTETVTTTQKETETQSTVSQTSTTISNHTTNEVALTENTSPEQTELPPIETTTVVTEPPSNSNEKLKFICEEYHIDAIEDFCEDVSGVIITGYEGTLPEHLIIPAQIDDKHVIAIGEGVFSGYNIKSLVIPDTVYEIQARAFMNCSYLSDIYLGINVLKIGEQAFFCSQYTGDGKQTITTPNPKFTDDEEAAFHGKQWDGRNHDYIIQIEY